MAELSFIDKLVAIQSDLKAPKDKNNDFGKYKYRSCESILEAVKPLLKKHGLYINLTDKLVCIEGWHYIEAIASVGDGKEIKTSIAYAREPDVKKGMDESQITGSASSYARKYALNGLFGIDDTKDADTNEHAKESKARAAQATQPIQTMSPTACSICGKEIEDFDKYKKETIIKQSAEKFGAPICFPCMAARAEKKRQQEGGNA